MRRNKRLDRSKWSSLDDFSEGTDEDDADAALENVKRLAAVSQKLCALDDKKGEEDNDNMGVCRDSNRMGLLLVEAAVSSQSNEEESSIQKKRTAVSTGIKKRTVKRTFHNQDDNRNWREE